MHATLSKFGYPGTLIAEYQHWAVLLRPQQVTLGSLVLCSTGESPSFAELPSAAYAELEIATRAIERGLRAFRAFDRINYIMLMMVDPHVHFHVLPRYSSLQIYQGVEMADAAWPGPPDMKASHVLAPEVTSQLTSDLRQAFGKAD
jgi:diadenosine tetraphosphate (Ap4A) HIT family hydrolase